MLEHLNVIAVKPSRVVVMGGSGFVGGAIVHRLESAGIQSLSIGHRTVDLLAPDGADRLASMLTPEDSFIAVSALAPVKNLEMLAKNIVMVRAIIEALIKVPPLHILNIGSDAVFGDKPLPLTESSPKAPTSLHGAMHAAREIAFSDVKAPLATLRPTLIYGAADPHNGYGPNRFLRSALSGNDIALFGEGEERRDHIFINDVAELAVQIVLHRSRGSLNAVTGQVRSFRAIAEDVAQLFNPPPFIKTSPRQGPIPHGGYRPFNNGATFVAFPDFRYTSFEEGLGRTCKQLKGNI